MWIDFSKTITCCYWYIELNKNMYFIHFCLFQQYNEWYHILYTVLFFYPLEGGLEGERDSLSSLIWVIVYPPKPDNPGILVSQVIVNLVKISTLDRCDCVHCEPLKQAMCCTQYSSNNNGSLEIFSVHSAETKCNLTHWILLQTFSHSILSSLLLMGGS